MSCELNFTIQEQELNFSLNEQKLNFCLEDSTDLNFSLSEQKLNFCLDESLDLNFGIKEQYIISGAGTNYKSLNDKPQINNHTLLSGNNTYEYLGIEPTITDITEQDIDEIIFGS